jgi:folylpolyglutamate synthase/dihydropteroate synthase
VVVTESIHPRAMKAEAMVEMAHRFARPAEAVLPVERALTRALELTGRDAALVAAGSLFVAAGVRQAWHKMGLEMKNFEVARD